MTVLICAWAAAVPARATRYAGHDVELQFRNVGTQAIRVTIVPKGTADVEALIRTPILEQSTLGNATAVDGDTWSAETNGWAAQAADANAFRVERRGPAAERLRRTFTLSPDARTVRVDVGDAPILGLGEGADGYDRRGHAFPSINGQLRDLAINGGRVHVPLLISTDGWAVLFLGPEIDVDLTQPGVAAIQMRKRQETPVVDFVLFDARDPVKFFADLTTLVGRAALPPRYAMGYMQSHRTLASVDEMLRVARTFREKRLPCDALIYLGTGFCAAGWNKGHDSFDFNSELFGVREPNEVIADLHAMHYRVVLHIIPPGLTRGDTDLYGSIPARPDERRGPGQIAQYWARHKPLIEAGADAWWPDDGDWYDHDARVARHAMYFDGPLAEQPDVRPWSLHRNGALGVARYGGWIWSGDVQSTWQTLARQVEVGVNTSLSLTPFWGTDIAGFWNTPELDGELYTRWFQFAAFTPSFRGHGRMWHTRLPFGWNTDGETGPVEGQTHPKPASLRDARVEPICKATLELRYALLPYTYTLAREARDTGLPMMRALWIGDPTDAKAAAIGSEFTWGRDLLVAPVVERGATSRSLYLPRGSWYDWWTNERHTGGQTISRPVDLATLPLYVRAGAIVPVDPVRQYVDEPATGPTTLRVYRGADGTFTLYDDDGISMRYRNDEAAGEWTHFAWDDAAATLSVSRDGRSKGPSAARSFEVLALPDRTTARLDYDGATEAKLTLPIGQK